MLRFIPRIQLFTTQPYIQNQWTQRIKQRAKQHKTNREHGHEIMRAIERLRITIGWLVKWWNRWHNDIISSFGTWWEMNGYNYSAGREAAVPAATRIRGTKHREQLIASGRRVARMKLHAWKAGGGSGCSGSSCMGDRRRHCWWIVVGHRDWDFEEGGGCGVGRILWLCPLFFVRLLAIKMSVHKTFC